MAYIKNTWQTGDVVTSEKLNNIEQGVAAACPVLFVHESYDASSHTYALDKTWQEIFDAMEVGLVILLPVNENNETAVTHDFIKSASVDEYSGKFYISAGETYATSTSNGYPSYYDGED